MFIQTINIGEIICRSLVIFLKLVNKKTSVNTKYNVTGRSQFIETIPIIIHIKILLIFLSEYDFLIYHFSCATLDGFMLICVIDWKRYS